MEKETPNVYKRIGALNWRFKRRNLESDPGLSHLMSKLGKIEWESKPHIQFQRNEAKLLDLKIV
jgi:hypothetical protein